MSSEKKDRLDTLEKVAVAQTARPGNSWTLSSLIGALKEDCRRDPEAWWKYRENTFRQRPEWAYRADRGDNYFIYTAESDPTKIGFTPSVEYGRADRQIVTTVTKFLKKYFPHYDDSFIAEMAALHRIENAPKEVVFAFSADDIETVYRRGPRSCMTYDPSDYRSSEYPVRIYDGPDVFVAALRNEGSDDFTARTVCFILNNGLFYTRIYGDEAVLRARLEALGMKEGTPQQFEHASCRLRLVRENNNIICPYLDGGLRVNAESTDDFLYTTRHGSTATQTSGYLYEEACDDDDDDDENDDRPYCEGCDNHVDELVPIYTQDDPTFGDFLRCESCCDNDADIVHGVRRTTTSGSSVQWGYLSIAGGAIYNQTHELWHLNIVSLNAYYNTVYCESDDEYYSSDDERLAYVDGSYFLACDTCIPRGHDDPIHQDDCSKDYDNVWILTRDACIVDGCTFHPDYPPAHLERNALGEWQQVENREVA